MAAIERVEILMVDLPPKVARGDAIQSFVSQETPIVRVHDRDGGVGTGYSYTIGTGGSSVVRLIRDHLAPVLVGRDADMVEDVWRTLLFKTHATWPGAVTSLALAAIDTALWDLRCRRAGLPLHVMAGGAQEKVPVYTTEGGWLQLTAEELVEEALQAKERGFRGVKVKVGKPTVAEDAVRVAAVREALGPELELMVDANQGLTLDQALRRARALEGLDLAWLEEPLPADDVAGHARLAAATAIPVAVGESLYSPGQFRDYLMQGACSVVQVDVARIGGVTPWLKVAHLAEA
ncbi:MAG TPA: mandelate racemase/muconate lactonizing enzyme family protein, partial [Geminicoccaceae bacterium]|nr:mandelate racemase/muconate lactonizing enzyme family protein [Geminicoccaceae bacterium]